MPAVDGSEQLLDVCGPTVGIQIRPNKISGMTLIRVIGRSDGILERLSFELVD